MKSKISRRNFLATSGVLAGGALINPVEKLQAAPEGSLFNATKEEYYPQSKY